MADRRLLGQRYELGEELGYGGMAEVFLARDTRLGRDVAVKVLRADLARDPAFLGRFRREAQSAAGLNHPNIVGVYDTGESGGVPYIVMEYVAGRTLREVLAEDGRLLPRRALEIVGEICGALEYSHRGGIVHRDIKPGNVMLTRAGDVKVMDFGIARAASQSAATVTQTAQVLGTAQYLSPEQARGEHVDGRSDVYSTGCVLYELLTGVPPFQGDSAFAVAYQHVREDPLPPSQIEPELPSSLDAVVLKAMAKNPANRYQSAAEFQADVERAAAGRRVEATPVLPGAATAVIPPASPTTVLLRPDDKDRQGRRVATYVALAVLVLAVFVIAALLVKGVFSGTTPSTKTPQVIGLTLEKAEAAIEADGLLVGTTTPTPEGENGNTQPSGIVYNQSPLVGFSAKKGSTTIDLFYSTGIKRVAVPDVTNLSDAAARAQLTAAGLTVSIVKEENVAGTAGTVLSSSPVAGSTVNVGTAITLTEVSGSQQVPDVQNEQYEQAAATLQSAGFVVKEVLAPDVTDPGTVIAENPSPGTTEKTGTTITLTVSTGPSTSSSAPVTTSSSGSPTPSAPTSPTPSTGASGLVSPSQ
jgi:serine/threonine protein kinase